MIYKKSTLQPTIHYLRSIIYRKFPTLFGYSSFLSRLHLIEFSSNSKREKSIKRNYIQIEEEVNAELGGLWKKMTCDELQYCF